MCVRLCVAGVCGSPGVRGGGSPVVGLSVAGVCGFLGGGGGGAFRGVRGRVRWASVGHWVEGGKGGAGRWSLCGTKRRLSPSAPLPRRRRYCVALRHPHDPGVQGVLTHDHVPCGACTTSLEDGPQGPPTAKALTTNHHQPPPTANCQLPTANRHQTANRQLTPTTNL